METGGFQHGCVRALLGAALACAMLCGVLCGRAAAATFTAGCTGTTGDVPSLITAINSANSSAGPDTVALGQGCTYTLTALDNNWYGPTGLPPIASDITIEGNGSTIARSASAPHFRLFFVGADPLSAGTNQYVTPGPGVLTLRNVTLTGGLARGGDSDGGGGGAGMGGAIFSQGVVTVDHSTIAGNTAHGGASGNGMPGIGNGGGGIGTDSPGTGAGGGFGSGSFGGGSGGGSNSGGGGGGAGVRATENGVGANMSGAPGAGGGPLTGTGGFGGNNGFATGAAGGDGGGGGGSGVGADGGAFGAGGLKPNTGGGSAGGGVGGGGSQFADIDSGGGGGGFGGGGGEGSSGGTGGGGGFGGGGGYGPGGGGAGGLGGGTATTTGGGGGGAGMGGAIFNMEGQLTIVDSTLTANAAVPGADNVTNHAKGLGGAVFNLNGSFSATASTFSANTATLDGASIFNIVYDGATARTAQTTLADTIVADGPGSPPNDITASKPPTTSGAVNLGTSTVDVSRFDLVRTMDALGGSITGSPLTADPLLGPLQNNGGPTETMAPATGSPVIDAGGGCPATDQRGRPRPDNGESACDIGAFEVQDPPGGGGGGSGGGGGAAVPVVSKVALSPTVFRAAPSGPSAVSARRRFGTTVTFTLTLAARVRFTVIQSQPGRVGKGARCLKQTRANRRARRCTRIVTLAGSFTLAVRAGANRVRFTGRLNGHALRPASYRLVATPFAGAKPGTAASAAFRISRS